MSSNIKFGKRSKKVKLNQSKPYLTTSELQAKALNFLGHRSRSIFEMATYLARAGADRPQVDQVITYLLELDLLDDQALANAYVKDALNLKKRGPKLIALELKHKFGVDAAIIKQALDQVSEQDYLDLGRKLLNSKKSLFSKGNAKEQRQRIYTLLQRRGFTGTQIQRIIDAWEASK